MVLIQLLLPTSGASSADGLALLAQTRRELADAVTPVRPALSNTRPAVERISSATDSRAE
jgi:hypothetical protein